MHHGWAYALSNAPKSLYKEIRDTAKFYIGLDLAIPWRFSGRNRRDSIFHSADTCIAMIVPGNQILPFDDLATISFFIAIAVAVHKGNRSVHFSPDRLSCSRQSGLPISRFPWLTAPSKATGTTDGNIAGCGTRPGRLPDHYIFTEIFSRDNIPGMFVIAGIYVFCMFFAIRCSKKRAAEVEARQNAEAEENA